MKLAHSYHSKDYLQFFRFVLKHAMQISPLYLSFLLIYYHLLLWVFLADLTLAQFSSLQLLLSFFYQVYLSCSENNVKVSLLDCIFIYCFYAMLDYWLSTLLWSLSAMLKIIDYSSWARFDSTNSLGGFSSNSILKKYYLLVAQIVRVGYESKTCSKCSIDS